MMEKAKLVQGGTHFDERGAISFVNDVSLDEIKRFYLISNKSTKVIRAWQAHKREKKYFYAVEGSFSIALVKLDNFDHPSANLKPEIFELHEESSQILIVPPGFANGIRAKTEKNKLLVFSSLGLQESALDTFRFPENLWYDWNSNEVAD